MGPADRKGDWAIGTITSLTATEIAKKVNSAVNAVVIPLFEQARRDAKATDDARRRGDTLGPLHGVPMTIKEQFLVKDTATTFGLPHQRNHRATLRWGWEGMSARSTPSSVHPLLCRPPAIGERTLCRQ